MLDNRSVSPVIGTILVVAITVILAAVIGATAFGYTDRLTDSPPQANLQADQEQLDVDDINTGTKEYTAVTITHTDGENIDKDNIRVTVNGDPAYATLQPSSDFYDITNDLFADILIPWDSVDGDSISAGDETVVILGTNQIKNNSYEVGVNNIHLDHRGDRLVFNVVPADDIVEGDGARLNPGDTVRVIWESGDQSVSLLEYEVS